MYRAYVVRVADRILTEITQPEINVRFICKMFGQEHSGDWKVGSCSLLQCTVTVSNAESCVGKSEVLFV
jgi:hypothetical protein